MHEMVKRAGRREGLRAVFFREDRKYQPETRSVPMYLLKQVKILILIYTINHTAIIGVWIRVINKV